MGRPPADTTEQRIKRLESLFSVLLLTSGDGGDDEEVWFFLRRLFQRYRDHERDDHDFEYLVDRLMHQRRRSQPESLLYQFEGLESKVRSLQAKVNTLQVETHSLLAIQALGLDAGQVRSTRFIPVRAYIDETPEGAIDAISRAIDEVLTAFDFSVADEFPAIKGSWFKKWFGKTKDVLSQPEVIERLEKIERAVELKAIDKPQAEIDEKQAGAISKLIKSLDKVPNAAVQAGSVLVVKLTTAKGPVIQARTLSQDEMLQLENNQLLLQDPAEVLGRLSAACSNNRKNPSLRA
ncbi:MAG TPA: hypothetical protein GXX56_04485 [Rhodocyclaceae bacterium]|nr:hypothetical protein [Rhodocyclaceae bacterium]